MRMAPVILSLTGMNLRVGEKLFIGWFGPRGLVSIMFAVIAINEQLPGGDTLTITVVCTVLMSIISHSISVNSLVNALIERLKISEDK